MEMNKGIFKSYDIRGLYPSEINPEVAVEIARAYVYVLTQALGKEPAELKIAVGYDVREASEPLGKAFIKTCLELGVNVDNLGLMSVNDIYFSAGYYKYDGGIMMTASHNPPGYGGMKMVYLDPKLENSVEVISGKQILESLDKASDLIPQGQAGELGHREIFSDHLDHILSFIDKNKIKPLKIVVDSGNGMNGKLAKGVIVRLGCQIVELFSEPDGSFANRPPNPLEKDAYKKCADKVIETQADLGVLFDVDGDRMFLVSEKGEFIRGDETLILLSKSILEKTPGATIVYNLICSHAVPETITKWGGRAVRSEVGYKNLAKHMKNTGGLASGEVSGHFAFAKNYYTDNALVAMALVVEALSQSDKQLSELISEFRIYHRGDEINLQVDDTQKKLDVIRQKYQENILDEIDGITVEFDTWWFNIRPSNTEPLLRITVEAGSEDELRVKTEEVVGVIKN